MAGSRAAISTTPRLWILYAATPLARIEVFGRRLLADREVILQALDAQPGVLRDHLHRLAEREEDPESRAGALEAAEGYLAARAGPSLPRSSTTCARPAKPGRPARLSSISSGTSTSRG